MRRTSKARSSARAGRTSRPVIGALCVLCPMVLLAIALQARGVSFFGTCPGQPLADLMNAPNSIYTFDPPTITWKMTHAFRERFPLPKQHEQVRLAIKEWETGMTSAIGHLAPTYGWTRGYGANKNFFDMRSILVHEIGHALGSQHPDAAWFNPDDTGAPYNLNFIPWPSGPSGFIPGPPLGGEVMNEGNDGVSLPGSKPPKGIHPGAYWRTLSKDELALLNHAYPSMQQFVEVGPDEEAQLIIDAFDLPSQDNLGIGGIVSSQPRDPNDCTQGRKTLEGIAKIRFEAGGKPIGFMAAPKNWEITNNTNAGITAIDIVARGTNNPIPTSWSSSGSNKFNFQGALVIPIDNPAVFDLEDIHHRFGQPIGGSIGVGQTVGVGLQKDVWDWTVVKAQALLVGNTSVPIGLVSVIDFFTLSSGMGSPAGGGGGNGDPFPGEVGGRLDAAPTLPIAVTGLKVQNQNTVPVAITQLMLSPAPELSPYKTDLLNSDTLDDLEQTGNLIAVSVPSNLAVLQPGACFYIVIEGSPDDLPPDVLQEGNWMSIQAPPGLMNDQLFVYVQSHSAGFSIANFSLLNTPVFDAPHCPGDLDFDGTVGVSDLLQLLACWGPIGPGSDCAHADLDGDLSVGVSDLLQLLASWGPCPR